MRFSELRNLQQQLDSGRASDMKDDEFVSQLQAVLDNLYVPEHPLDYLYKDLVNVSTEDEPFFSQLLGTDSNYYESARNNAEQCIAISRKCRSIVPRKAESWIKSLLKAWDPVIVCYAQEIKKVKIAESGKRHTERQVYKAVMPISRSLMELALAMDAIYQMRNKLTHQQYHFERENKIKFKKLPNHKLKHYLESSISQMEQKLPAFIKDFRNEYAALNKS